MQFNTRPAFGRNFTGLLSFLRAEDAPTIISPHRFSIAIGVDIQTLAECSGLHEKSLALTPAAENVQSYLRNSLRVIQVSSDISENIEKAIAWFKSSNVAALDHKTPQSLVSVGRTDDVVNYLRSIESGFAG